MSDSNIESSSFDKHARRLIAVVAGLNFLGFAAEMVIATVIGSASLYADAADFLEDFLINILVLTALGWTVASRQKASYALAVLILIPAFSAFAMAFMKIFSGQPPEPLILSATAIAAMFINFVCAVLLLRLRSSGSALVRGAWLAARNDVAANLLILGAGLLTFFWASSWPDAVMGFIIGAINLGAAKEVFEQARAEKPELEE